MHLINLSIREGRFSSRWKPQLIFPHHKKKSRDLLENYRPVSHLVQIGIMVEYAVYLQIVEHFVKYDLFHLELGGGGNFLKVGFFSRWVFGFFLKKVFLQGGFLAFF